MAHERHSIYPWQRVKSIYRKISKDWETEMSIRKGLLGVIAAASLAATTHFPALAESVDLLRSIPLEIKDYAAGKTLPEKPETADQILNAIDNTPVLLVHMEAIRRAYHYLSPAEQEKLLSALFKRHQKSEWDLRTGFDHGYAQLVIKENKTGLFFLRKANDRFQDQFSNLAYGMAQVQADINLENAKPEETTTRKMDATYKLSDAVLLDAAKHQPGFWPSYMRVIERMKPLPAYASFTRRDFSLAYIPYGNKVIPMGSVTTASIPLKSTPDSLLAASMGTPSCDPGSGTDVDTSGSSAVSQRNVNFSGTSALIQFFNTEETGLFRVRVLSADGSPMLSFRTYDRGGVIEDLEGDGTFEIVARQYQQDPFNPVIVYRYTPCGFELDKQVFENFR